MNNNDVDASDLLFRIRQEVADDTAAIQAVTEQAFAGKPFASGTEPQIPARLRANHRLTLSLVAVVDGETAIGHAAASPVTIVVDGANHGGASSKTREADNWYGVGPVSVLPAYQRNGVGSALVRELLTQLQSLPNAAGCVVLGDPDYYSRFGFVARPELTYPGPDPKYFQTVAWVERVPKGVVKFDDAFG